MVFNIVKEKYVNEYRAIYNTTHKDITVIFKKSQPKETSIKIKNYREKRRQYTSRKSLFLQGTYRFPRKDLLVFHLCNFFNCDLCVMLTIVNEK